VIKEEEEDQDVIINLDNSSELSGILSFEIDSIDSISNSKDSDNKGNSSGDVLRTRSGKVFGI
jgi:hypothetical protein